MMGQGANQAIVDAYVVSKRLAAAATASGSNDGPEMTAIAKALRDYDSKKRRKDNDVVITKARNYGKLFLSKNPILSKILRWSIKMAPPSNMVREAASGDR